MWEITGRLGCRRPRETVGCRRSQGDCGMLELGDQGETVEITVLHQRTIFIFLPIYSCYIYVMLIKG